MTEPVMLAKDMLAAAAITERMDWYSRKSDGTLLTGYLLGPAEVARIYAAGAAGVHLGDEGLRKALEPFADFADPTGTAPATLPITQGSGMARRQLTMGDCYAARAALAGAEFETYLERLRGTLASDPGLMVAALEQFTSAEGEDRPRRMVKGPNMSYAQLRPTAEPSDG